MYSDSAMLDMLKVDLGITANAYDARLLNSIDAAKTNITAEGVSDLNLADIADVNLVLMYAAWTWRRRDTMEAMPRMLRWQLNNRVMGVKAR